MKAQSFFGGTHPKETGKGVRQVGHKGSIQNKTGNIGRKTNVKQVANHDSGTTYARKTNNRQVGHTGRHS